MNMKLIGAICAVMMAPAMAAGQEAGPLAVGTPDPMANVYGNTITVDIVPFYSAKQYIDPDHTWREVSDDSELRGTWTFENNESCFTQTDPPGPTRCFPYVPRKLGDHWTNTDKRLGTTVLLSLVEGRR